MAFTQAIHETYERSGFGAGMAQFIVADRLGTEPVIFPSGHAGFLGDEYGQPGDLDGFAAKLHGVLDKA